LAWLLESIENEDLNFKNFNLFVVFVLLRALRVLKKLTVNQICPPLNPLTQGRGRVTSGDVSPGFFICLFAFDACILDLCANPTGRDGHYDRLHCVYFIVGYSLFPGHAKKMFDSMGTSECHSCGYKKQTCCFGFQNFIVLD